MSMDTTTLTPYTAIEEGTLLPSIDLGFIMPVIVTTLVVTGVVSVVFIVYLILSMIRRHKIQQATLDMQKDIRQIRELLEQGRQTNSTTPSIYSPSAARPNDIIASTAHSEINSTHTPDESESHKTNG